MTLQERIGELRKSVSLARAMGPPRDESGESQLIEQCRRQDEADLELLESVQADLAAERAARVAIAAAFGCQPDDSTDLVEAAKLLVAERDAEREAHEATKQEMTVLSQRLVTQAVAEEDT